MKGDTKLLYIKLKGIGSRKNDTIQKAQKSSADISRAYQKKRFGRTVLEIMSTVKKTPPRGRTRGQNNQRKKGD